MQKAYEKFLNDFPGFKNTFDFDELRKNEYPLLDEQNHTYLDFTGGNLYSKSQIEEHSKILFGGVYGNPHSTNPTSRTMTELVKKARFHVLSFFNADPEEYEVVFTKNTSEALKLVGESYPFSDGDQYLLTTDNHNSVLGIREFDRVRGAKTTYASMMTPSLTINEAILQECLDMAVPEKNNLFAYPAQSNFSGVQHSLDWVEKAHEKGWDVFLDAAAFVPTNKLDLSKVKPEYIGISVYKMFGWPTGVGALIAKRSALSKLHRPWFGGGTIVAVSVSANTHNLAKGAAGFEDGTLNYLSMPAIDTGLSFIEKLGIDRIHNRVQYLTRWLIDNLKELKHDNGEPVIRFYGDVDTDKRGGTIAINLFDSDGRQLDSDKVQAIANKQMISFRTGCFCNPGISETAFQVSDGEIYSCLSGASSYTSADDYRNCIGSIGAIRISIGFISNFHDVYKFVEFVKQFSNKD